MLTRIEVRSIVLEEIESLLLEDTDEVVRVNGQESIAELGLNSLTLARLVIQLESAVGADPFTSGDQALSDVGTVDGLVAAYERAVHQEGKADRDRAGL